jgi:hypothetical protein
MGIIEVPDEAMRLKDILKNVVKYFLNLMKTVN